MNEALAQPRAFLRRSTLLWFLATSAGLWVFLAYIIVVFGGGALRGGLGTWNDRLTHGHVPGDTVGNAIVAGHLLFAVIVLGAGPVQLVPRIRERFPELHRWVGRTYVMAVLAATLSGLHMLFTRDIGSWSLRAGFVLQAVLIVLFAALAVQAARLRRFERHRRWALRFFMVSSVALSYRVTFMIWFFLTGGVGIDFETGEGPFLDAMAVGQFLPLLALELYLWTLQRGSPRMHYAVAGLIGLAALLTGIGVAAPTLGQWFPLAASSGG